MHRDLPPTGTGMVVEREKLVSVHVGEISLVSHSKRVSKHTRFL